MDDTKQKKIIAANLTHYLYINNYQQKEVAQKLGIKPATFSTWCTGQSMPSVSTLIRIADLLGIELTDITNEHKLTNKPTIPTKTIPIVGTVACGSPIYAEENIIEYIAVNSTDNVDFALYAKGDSMNNCKIDDGDTVFIRSQSIVDNGDIALVLIDDNATIKRFYDYGEKIVLRPDSTNTEHKEQVYDKKDHNLSIQGKVVFIKTFIK